MQRSLKEIRVKDIHLKQKPPFRFIDTYTVIQSNKNKTIIDAKYSFDTKLHSFFQGHFPDEPIVPGVILIEAMAQSARISMYEHYKRACPGYLVSVEKARFNKLIHPHNIVTFRSILLTPPPKELLNKTNFISVKCVVFLGKIRAASAKIVLSI